MITGLSDGAQPRLHTHGLVTVQHIDHLKELGCLLVHLELHFLDPLRVDLGLIPPVLYDTPLLQLSITLYLPLEYPVSYVRCEWLQLLRVHH